jgi:hypothetical protein
MGFARSMTIAAMLLATTGGAMAQRPQRRAVTEEERQAARAALDSFTRPTLTRFESEAEFRLYVEAVRQVQRTSGRYHYAAGSGVQFASAQSDAAQPLCPPEQPDCLEEGERILVTGSRINPRNASITNNQMRGVEEGDIVKQIDHYLLVLQDGRIFVIDTRARGTQQLALTDRVDVYRNPRSDMWYDEMLVFGDRVLISGYSYDDAQTELAVFRLGGGGRLTREGVFRISSNDYYSGSNYATRLIGDTLITYTPLDVGDIARADFKWPVIRRWLPQDDAWEIARAAYEGEAGAPGPPLIDAAAIYRPVQRVVDPAIHTVSVCPLGSTAGGRNLECRTTAFAAESEVQWYVTNSDVYLWTSSQGYWRDQREECTDGSRFALADFAGALLYRVPHSGARPDLVAARGFPPDQFAMQADARNFYALARMEPARCQERWGAPARLAFVSIPLARLGPTLSRLPDSALVPMPSTASRYVASRFTDRYLVYGGLSRFRGGWPDLGEDAFGSEYRRSVADDLRPRPAYVVPVERPAGVRALDIGHSMIRAERVADDIVLTGYRDPGGLIVTLIDLDGPPRIASSVRLDGRYESEGRSHAFNSLIEPGGGGLMGLPTVRRVADSDREYWRSRASDLSFLAFTRRGLISPIGTLERRFAYVDSFDETTGAEDQDGVPGYRCEVSCVDWYGNSRPIFTDGRIFALSGAELIEGRLENGRIREVGRVNFALAPVPAR